ncbi:Receptor-type tyrosine-protein phosphatase mu [Holothuria leucospilota]|uniref:protein-tyrosine-phosphatase n=1 Tax=Holothuria leucospilota TaxID=206669 RepID=A0A9Q1C9R3_HOLLE|nr:Receptor-type tyrosine-protein phosphatase mu [Holothuria leucospilota]
MPFPVFLGVKNYNQGSCFQTARPVLRISEVCKISVWKNTVKSDFELHKTRRSEDRVGNSKTASGLETGPNTYPSQVTYTTVARLRSNSLHYILPSTTYCKYRPASRAHQIPMNLWKENKRNWTVLALIGFGLSLYVSTVYCQATCGSTTETEGTFGVNCSEVCTCAVNAVCNNITGQCSGSLCGSKEDTFACDKNDLKVVVSPSSLFVAEATSFMVTCIVNLTPEDVTVSWRNPRGIIVTSGGKYEMFRKSDTVYDLTVTNAGPEDSGLYTCIATLNHPTFDFALVQESKKIIVFAQGKIFEFPKSVVKKMPGETLQLTCKALFEAASQSSSLRWTWNEGAVDFNQTLQLIEDIEYFGTTQVVLTRTLDFSNLTRSMGGTYACSASENGNNESDKKEVDVFIVEPAEISDLHLSSKTPWSLYFTWNVVSTGNDDNLCIAQHCLEEECSAVCCMSEVACNITGLSPDTTYNISVICDNYAGSSKELTFFGAKTTTSGPLSPVNPEVQDSSLYCNITWEEPRQENGPGLYYQIRQTIARRDTQELEAQFYTEKIYDTKFSTQKKQLALNSVFSFDICAGNDHSLGGCISGNETCVTDFGAPDSVPDLRLASSTDSVTSSSFTLLTPIVDDRNGPISCYEFVVLESEVADLRADPDSDYPFNSVQDKQFNRSLPYRALVLTGERLQDTSTIIIGGEQFSSSVCKLSSVSSRNKRSGHLPIVVSTLEASNEALKGDTDYKIFMRVYVGLENGTSMYASSRYLQVKTTKTGGIVSIIVIILALSAVATVLFVIWMIQRRHWVQKKTITRLEDGHLNGGYVNQGFAAGTASYLSLQSMNTSENLSSSSYLSLKQTVAGINSMQPLTASLDITRQQSVTAPPDPHSQDTGYLEMKGNIQKPSCEDVPYEVSSEATESKEYEEEEYTSSCKRDLIGHSIEDTDLEMEEGEKSDKEIDYEEIPPEMDDDYSRVLYEKLLAPVPLHVSELPSYIEQRKGSGPKSLEREFELLPKGQQEPWAVAVKEENASKNPFPNILPYDHTRVKLFKLQNDSSSDYYNASFITDQFNKTSFIAAQGPSSSTLEDFWRMVWQEKVEVIVMVTNLEEEDKQLCVQYWPEVIDEKIEFGEISVKLSSVESFSDFQVRKMQIQKETEPSAGVIQFQYLSWPYLKVPQNTTSLLSFAKLVKEAQKNVQVPNIIHCSDGAGATGTFLALCCLLDDLSEGNEISVYDFVKKMRKNRVNMVQTKTQYVYLYNALLEAHLTPQSELSAEALNEMNITPDLLLDEFQVLKKLTSYSRKKEKGSLEENKHKNRFSDIIPVDQCRPLLSSESLMGGNDYINASLVNSFLKKNAYILTQSPLPTTVEDFWRLVFDYQCRTIVVLHRIDGSSKTLPYYWPRGGSVQYGSLSVENIGVENFDGFIQRKFTVSHLDKMDARPVTQIHLNSWETDDPSILGDFFSTAEKYQESPTLVHCLDGCAHSGVFVTVQCEMQRFRHSRRINIFSRVRELGTANPYIIPKMEDYAFCHKILKYMVNTEPTGNELKSDSN